MIKFIFSPLVAVLAIVTVLVMCVFLAIHVLLKLSMLVTNIALAAAGYKYRVFIEANEEDEK